MEDLIDHMTNGLISVHDMELQLSQYREIHVHKLPDPFKTKNLIDVISAHNVK